MDFTAALEAASQTQGPGGVCTIAVVLDALDDADGEALLAALDDRTVAGTTIAKAVSALGHQLRANTVHRHRRGECACQ